jgi:cytochrome c-type biogenesis protein CcmH
MVERLSEKLQANPNDGAGWLMLARSYSVLGRFPESAAAYGRAVGLMPPDAQMLADFADTIAMAQGRKLLGEPEKLVRRSLEIDPRNLKALALSGTIYFQRQDFKAAIGEWQKYWPWCRRSPMLQQAYREHSRCRKPNGWSGAGRNQASCRSVRVDQRYRGT